MPTGFFDDPHLLAPPATRTTALGEGAFVLQSPEALAPYARCVGEWLEQWALETPDATDVAERVPGGGWRTLGWRALRQHVGAVAQPLLDLDLAPEKALVVLSDNCRPGRRRHRGGNRLQPRRRIAARRAHHLHWAGLPLLRLEHCGPLLHIRWNRPAKRNSVNDELLAQLHTVFVHLPAAFSRP